MKTRALNFTLTRLPLVLALLARVAFADPPAGLTPSNGGCGPGGNCIVKSLRVQSGGSGATPPAAGTAQAAKFVSNNAVGNNGLELLQQQRIAFGSSGSDVCDLYYSGGSNISLINCGLNVTHPSNGTVSATLVAAGNGSVGAPSLEFSSESNSGLYRVGVNDLGVAINGAKVWDWQAATATSAQHFDVTGVNAGNYGIGLNAGANGVCFNGSGAAGCTLGISSNSATGVLSAITTSGSFGFSDSVKPGQTTEQTFGIVPTTASAIGYGSAQWLTRQVAPHPANTRRIGYGTILTTSDTSIAVVGMSAISNLGASVTSAPATDTARNMISYATGAVSGNTAGFVGPLTQTRMSYLPAVGAVVRTDTAVTSTRIYVGFTSSDLSGAATLAATNGFIYCAFRFDTGIGDANWQACSSDATTASCLDTGIAVAASTTYRLYVDGANATRCNFSVNGVVKNDKSTNISTSSATNLGPQIEITTLTTAARALLLNRFSLEQN